MVLATISEWWLAGAVFVVGLVLILGFFWWLTNRMYRKSYEDRDAMYAEHDRGIAGLYERYRPGGRGRSAPPEGAHFRRFEGSYGSIWFCDHGHAHVGEVDTAPEKDCFRCTLEGLGTAQESAPAVWRRGTTQEAHDFIFELEGFKAYSGVGFELIS